MIFFIIRLDYDFDGNLWTQIHQTLSEHLPFENVGYHPQRLPLPEINVRFRPYTEDLFISPRDSLSRHQPYHMHMFLFACDSIQTLKSRYRSIIGKWLGTIHSRKNQRALIVVMQKRIIVNSVQGVITASKDFTVAEFLAETLRGTSSEIGDPTAMERTSLISLNGLDTLDQMPIDCAYLIEKIKSILHDSFWSTFDTISTEVQGLERTMELPGWNYCQFFITKEALALCYQSVGLLKEAVEIYDALIATFKSRGSIIDYSIYSTLLSADEGLKGAQTGSVSTELIIKSDKFLTIDSKSDNHDEFFSSSSQKIEKYTTEGDSDRSVLGESLGLIESKAGGHLDFEKKSSQTTCGFEMFNILEMHADKSVRERILKNVVGENELFAYVFSCQAKILGDAMNFGEVLDRTRFFLNDHLEAVSHSNLVDYNSMSDACVTGSSGGNDRLSRKTGIHCWVLHTGVAIIDRCNQGRSHDSSSLLMSLTLLLLHLKASVDSVLTQYGQISGEIVSSKLGFEDPIGSISPGELIPQYLVDFVVSKTYLSIADFYSIREAISEAILRTLDRNRGPLGRRLLVSVKLDFASFYMRFNKFSSALVLYDDLVHFFKQGNMDDLWNSFAASVMCGRGDCTLALGNREVALEGYMEAWRQAVIGHHNFNIGKKICSQVKRLCRFLNGKKVELNSIDQYFGVTFNFLESAINESISINSVTITAKIPGTLVDENMIDEVHLTMLSDHSEISFSSKDRDIKVVGFPEFDQCDLSKSVDGVSKWSFKLITEEYVCTDDVYRVGRLSIHIGDIIFKQDYLPVYKMHPVRFSQSSQPVSLTVSQGQIGKFNNLFYQF